MILSKFKFSILAALLAFGLCASANAAKLHLIAAADSGDEGIGTDVAVDLVNVVVLAERIAEDTDMELSATVITSGSVPNAAKKSGGGKHASYKAFAGKFGKFSSVKFSHTKTLTKKTIRDALKGIKAGSDDVIWFHYAGHGFRWNKQGAEWPALDLGGWVKAVNNDESAAKVKAAAEGSLQMQEVMNTIEAKGARLTIAISDACNENNNIVMPKGAKAKGRGKSKLAAGFVKLFRKAKGYIRISSTKPEQLAWGNADVGGVFTYLFIEQVIKQANKGDKTDWAKLLKKFKNNGSDGSGISMDLGDGDMSEEQHPVVKEQISYGSVGAGGGAKPSGGAKPGKRPARVSAAAANRLRRPIRHKGPRPGLTRPTSRVKQSPCMKSGAAKCKSLQKKRRFKSKKASQGFYGSCLQGVAIRCKGKGKGKAGKPPAPPTKSKAAQCARSAKISCTMAMKRSKVKKKKQKAFMSRCTKSQTKRCLLGSKKAKKGKKTKKRSFKKLFKRKKK